MTRSFVFAAVLVAVTISPLAAQTSSPSGTSSPASRYRLGPTKTSSQPAPTKSGQNQAGTGQRQQVLGPPAPTSRTTTDRNVRPAGDNQPIREPGNGQLPPRRPIGGANPGAVQPRADAPPQAPEWFPLAPNVQKWVDDVLKEWEKTSSQVRYFECKFERWEFEPVFGPRDGKTPKSYATGVIKYQDPDKGLFRVESLQTYVPPAKPDEKPTYVVPKDEFGEHWVSDGKSIFEFDNRQKKLIERVLPVAMQGKAIADGPLPFLFGAKAAAINARYWIRPVEPPAGVENEYWLEAWPKGRQDAANFKFVRIVIAQNDFMPSALSVYMPNFNAQRNPARVDYRFDARKARLKNDRNITAEDLLFWRNQFFEPKAPFGWKKEVQNLNDAPVANGSQPAPAPQARKPKTGLKFK